MIPLLMEADWQTVWNRITAHLKNGKSLRSLGDTVQLGAAELILRTTIPAKLHERSASVRLLQRRELLAADERHPYQPRVLYMMATSSTTSPGPTSCPRP